MHARNTGVQEDTGEVSDGNEEHVIGNWKKGNSCNRVTQRTWLNRVCILVFCERGRELVSNKIGYLVEKISKCGEPKALPSQNVPFGILFSSWLLRKKNSERTFGPTPFFLKGFR